MSSSKKLKTKQEKEQNIGVEYGVVGTNIFSGYIDEDYNSEWRDLQTKK